MSRENGGLGRERKNLFSDSIQENLATAARQIPATDTVGKKNVAAKKLAALGKIKTKAAGTVTRDVQQSGLGPGSGKRGVFLEQMRGVDGS